MTVRHSVIVVTRNNLHHTVLCVRSLMATVPADTQVILVDNGSDDGTVPYLEDVASREPRETTVLALGANEGWCRAVNRGLEIARGRYLVLLNNDTVLTRGWLDGLRVCMEEAPDEHPGLRRVGLAGPVTNSAGGPQAIPVPGPTRPDTAEEIAARVRAGGRRLWQPSFFLSGFCLMLARECYEEVGGLDERFSPGGYDDNDLVLRAQEAGWEAVIAGDVYVHHEGGATFDVSEPDMRRGIANHPIFLDKWRERRAGRHRLVAVYRAKNAEATIGESLDATAAFADAIVVLDDGSTDGTAAICREHPAVTRCESQDLPFDERRDRNRLLELAEELSPDWILSVDADEIFEMDRARAERLMQLADPHARVLGFSWYTFWEPSRTYFRSDGIFGGMGGYRMFRWEPGLRIVRGNENGLHCGNIPQFPPGSQRWTNVRVRHLGYETEELRRRKYEWYREIDPDPRPEVVGNSDYSHLVSNEVTLRRLDDRSGLSLCLITRNEAERLEHFLARLEPFVDEICVVDTGSDDRSVEIAERFTNRIARLESGGLDLDRARNRCLELATQPWILSLDPDEEIAPEDLPRFQRLMDDSGADAFTFPVANHQKDQGPVMTMAARLFRNDPRIRFSRPVHETIEESLDAHPELVVRAGEILISHYGFLKDDEEVERKVVRYFERNRTYREQNPRDPMAWYNEALHYLNEGNEGKAETFFRRALELDEEFLSPRSQLAFLYQERAMRLWHRLLELAPPEHPVHQMAEQFLDALEGVTPPRPRVGRAREREREESE